MRPLDRGQFGAAKVADGERVIQHEEDYILIDRSFQPGDFCKRAIDDLQSGVVVSVEVEGRLSQAVSRKDLPGWKSLDDLQGVVDVDVGDYVAVDDWIGTVRPLTPRYQH